MHGAERGSASFHAWRQRMHEARALVLGEEHGIDGFGGVAQLLELDSGAVKLDVCQLGGAVEIARLLQVLHVGKHGLGIRVGLVAEELVSGSIPGIPQATLLGLSENWREIVIRAL